MKGRGSGDNTYRRSLRLLRITAGMSDLVASCIQKLDIESMMAPDGLKKAEISLKLLGTQAAANPAIAAELASVKMLRPLLQTALLHPEVNLRLLSTTVVARCVSQENPSFFVAAVEARLPDASVTVKAGETTVVELRLTIGDPTTGPPTRIEG